MAQYKRKEEIPIDKGWAWVILLASFIGLLFMSLIYLNGIFQVVFLEAFERDKFTTSWIFSLNSSLLSFAGPLSSYLNRKLGPRLTVMIGSIIGSSGFILAAFSKTFTQIFVSYGLIVGVGFGIAYLPCAVTVGFYFEKYRNIAFGIVNMAIGIATIALSPFLTWTNEYFGWRGTMFILGGMYLQLCVVGSVLRPVNIVPELDETREDDEVNQRKLTDKNKQISSAHASVQFVSKQSQFQSDSADPGNLIWHSRNSFAIAGLMGSVADVKKLANGSNNSLSFILPSNKGKADQPIGASYIDISLTTNAMSGIERMTCSEYDISRTKRSLHTASSQGNNLLPLPTSSEYRKPEVLDQYSLCSSMTEYSHVSMNKVDLQFRGRDANLTYCERLTSYFELDICRNPSFILYCGMNFFLCVGVSLAYQHMPNYVQQNGTTRKGTATLLSLTGIANCASRFITGLAISNKRVNPVLVQIASNGLVGAGLLFMPLLVKSFSGQVVFAIIFGYFANCYMALMGPLTILIAGLENLSYAYGFLLLMCGIGFLIGPPMAGAIFDLTSRFEYCFITAGIFCILSSLVLLPVPLLLRKKRECEIPEICSGNCVRKECNGQSTSCE